MKVLVITPIYFIKGRENLFHDTNAIHYLLKYWPDDTEIVVIHEFHSSLKQIKRYTKQSEREYLKKGYHFTEDGIDVHMYELPIIPQQRLLFAVQKNYMTHRIEKLLNDISFQPDVVICHMPAYYVGQYLNRIDFKNALKIAVLHFADCNELRKNPRYKYCLESCFDHVLSRSVAIREIFRESGLNNLREDYIQSGVPANSVKIEKHWKDEELTILFVGKLIKRKHVDLIIKSLSEVNATRSFKFKIVGKGPEEKKLKALVSSLEMENVVEFYPYVPREKVFELMGSSDVFVMPSTEETFGLVYLEAMRQACIPIGTKGEGIDGIIQNERNGYLISPNDATELTNVLTNILCMGSRELEAISQLAKQTGDLFDEEKMSMEYYAVVKKYVGESL